MKEILGVDWIASMSKTLPLYDMPSFYDHTILERPVEKVNTSKDFINKCLELMQDETTLNALHGMIDQ
jgi:hypothetical protein